LANLDKTSISDDVQMIIRDIMFHSDTSLRPYILYDKDLSWEYQDLFPDDRFDLNPFDLEIGNDDEGRIDFARLLAKLQRMKSTFQLFDDSGNLWDRFCENLTIVINDPSNPSGFTNFNDESLLDFLKFISLK
jgi:ribosomal protein RSM22 (predicted rRNA methylase)